MNAAIEPINKIEENKDIISSLVLNGDLSKLKPDERVRYYFALCKSLNLDPLQKPFDLIELPVKGGGKKLVLYPNKNCAEQFRLTREISVIDKITETTGGLLIITMKARDKSGRIDIASAAVSIDGAQGDFLANAYMRCETKCKRRLTFSMAPTGLNDDVEFESEKKAIELDLTDDLKGLTKDGFLLSDELRQSIKKKCKEFKKKIGDDFLNYLPDGKTNYNQCSDKDLVGIDTDIGFSERILKWFLDLTDLEIISFLPNGKKTIHECNANERRELYKKLEALFDAPVGVTPIDDSDLPQ